MSPVVEKTSPLLEELSLEAQGESEVVPDFQRIHISGEDQSGVRNLTRRLVVLTRQTHPSFRRKKYVQICSKLPSLKTRPWGCFVAHCASLLPGLRRGVVHSLVHSVTRNRVWTDWTWMDAFKFDGSVRSSAACLPESSLTQQPAVTVPWMLFLNENLHSLRTENRTCMCLCDISTVRL